MNITFGTIKKSQRDTTSHVKYPNRAVVTIEGVKGENKTRRVLFNATAMEVLNFPVGATQNVIFGFVEADEIGNRRVLVANADLLPNKEQTVVYNTSKNKVSFEESKEKGKAIGNSYLHKEINSFLEIDENISHEYELVSFGVNQGLDLYDLVKITSESDNQSTNDFNRNPLQYDNNSEASEESQNSRDIELSDNSTASNENYHEDDAMLHIPTDSFNSDFDM